MLKQSKAKLKLNESHTKESRTRQDKARQHTTRQDKTRQGKARQGKARQGKARQGKAGQGKASQGQGKARQGKTRQGKARQGPGSQGNPTTANTDPDDIAPCLTFVAINIGFSVLHHAALEHPRPTVRLAVLKRHVQASDQNKQCGKKLGSKNWAGRDAPNEKRAKAGHKKRRVKNKT